MPLPTPHVAEGRYRIPADLLYLTKNQLDFCDIMFFLAHLEGSRFSLATSDFAWLFNKSAPGDRGYANARQVWGKHWRWARRQGWLEETTPEYNLAFTGFDSDDRDDYRGSGRRYYFRIVEYEQLMVGPCVEKPLGYVVNGWLPILRTAFQKRLLNFFLSEVGTGSRVPMEVCLNLFEQRLRETRNIICKNLDVKRALNRLIAYGIVQQRGDQLSLEPSVFDVDLADAPPPPPPADSLLGRLREIDPTRVDRTLEIMKLAGLPPSLTERVFKDLARFKPAEAYETLKKKAYARRLDDSDSKWLIIRSSARTALKKAKTSYRTIKGKFKMWKERPPPRALVFEMPLPEKMATMVLVVHSIVAPWAKASQGECTIHIDLQDSGGTLVLNDDVTFCSAEGSSYLKYPVPRSGKTSQGDEIYILRAVPRVPCEWLDIVAHLEIRGLES